MKLEVNRYKKTESFEIVLHLNEIEAKAVRFLWPDFCFPLRRDEGWGVIPDQGYGGVAWFDNNPVPGGKFVNGIWRGIIYPNGRPDIPDINNASAQIRQIAEKALTPAMESFEAYENLHQE